MQVQVMDWKILGQGRRMIKSWRREQSCREVHVSREVSPQTHMEQPRDNVWVLNSSFYKPYLPGSSLLEFSPKIPVLKILLPTCVLASLNGSLLLATFKAISSTAVLFWGRQSSLNNQDLSSPHQKYCNNLNTLLLKTTILHAPMHQPACHHLVDFQKVPFQSHYSLVRNLPWLPIVQQMKNKIHHPVIFCSFVFPFLEVHSPFFFWLFDFSVQKNCQSIFLWVWPTL